MQLELTKEQFLELMRLTFIGEFVINGHNIDDFDLPSQDLKEFIVQKAVENDIMDYIGHYSWSESYDYSIEKSGEFYGILSDYCEQSFHTELVELTAENILSETLGETAIEKMGPKEYDAIFGKTATAVDAEFQKNDYRNITLKS